MSYFKAKCTKFDFGWVFGPGPTGKAYSAPRPLAGFKGPTSMEGRGRKGKGEAGRKGEERR